MLHRFVLHNDRIHEASDTVLGQGQVGLLSGWGVFTTLKVSDAIHVTTSRDILAAMARGEGPTEAVVALGYAGWGEGQLEDEIRANAWLSAPVDSAIIFDLPFESRWEAAARLLGVELSRISAISGNA